MFGLRVSVLARVPEALPSTCMALEIDIDGRDVHNTESKHLCPVIRAIIPRLHHLRLRLKYLCPAIICTEGPKSLSSEHHGFLNHLSTAEYL